MRRSSARFVLHLVQEPVVQPDITARFVCRLDRPEQWASQYYGSVYNHNSDSFSMPEPDFYNMNTITQNNLPWRQMVCGLHSISIPIGYNRTYVHVCVRSEYGYNGSMPGAAAQPLRAQPAPPGDVAQDSGHVP